MINPVLEQELAEYAEGAKAYLDALQEKGIVFAEEGANQKRIDELRAML